MESKSVQMFVLRNVVLFATGVGFLWTRRQRNKARKELTVLREELNEAKISAVEATHRACRAEELNKTFAQAKVKDLKPEPLPEESFNLSKEI